MPDKATEFSHEELIDLLQDLLAKAERGEPFRAAFRYCVDGEWHDLAIGYETEEERTAVLSQLRGFLGQLH